MVAKLMNSIKVRRYKEVAVFRGLRVLLKLRFAILLFYRQISTQDQPHMDWRQQKRCLQPTIASLSYTLLEGLPLNSSHMTLSHLSNK